ncbi:hypothetical protein MTR67_040636 [Solanum verrucosum]|uniref:Uncharacterized protein n=1 Tax=Solanum verrucosum TaxID=315347 RepID=A0AAF0ZPZ4_SOLVR|nr:hypothetical protein MTR67_040636 [Solanum verrucosum]
MKWLWKYSTEQNQLWGRVIKFKHEQMDNWMTKEVTSLYVVRLWKFIRVLWSEMQEHSKIKVSNGNKTSFWNDKWHEVGILKVVFPDIYNLTNHHLKIVAEMWSAQGWNVSFRRQMNDWEINRVADFFNTLNQFSGLQTREDTLMVAK